LFDRFFGDCCLILVLTVVPVLLPPKTAPVLPSPVSVGRFGMGLPVREALGTLLETILNAANVVQTAISDFNTANCAAGDLGRFRAMP
jgi:hypothetical protein